MGSAKVVLPIADGDSAVINTWLVREGDVVTEGKTILRFTCLGRCEPLIVESVGRIGKVLLAQGSTVGAGEPVCTLHPCPHEECFNGICTACGVEVKEDRSSFGFFGGVASNVLRRSQEGVVSQQQQRVQELLGAKKLALVLDLDHTLLHTMFPASEEQHATLLRAQSMTRDIRPLNCKGMVYFTKLRPHVLEFLHTLAPLYELYIYTAGDRAYANVVADVLDEHKRFFPGRIISRDDYPDVAKEHKNLDKVFPIAEHWRMVLILDDNNVTWDHELGDGRNSINNLIHCDKYSFWPRHMGETHNPVPQAGLQHHAPAAIQSPHHSPASASNHAQSMHLGTRGTKAPRPNKADKRRFGGGGGEEVSADKDGDGEEDRAVGECQPWARGPKGEEEGEEEGEKEGEKEGEGKEAEGAEWVSAQGVEEGLEQAGGSGDEGGEDGNEMQSEIRRLLALDASDVYLRTLSQILTQLHASFYSRRVQRGRDKGLGRQGEEVRDVRKLLSQRQKLVLTGVKVAFSGVFKHPGEYTRRLQQLQQQTQSTAADKQEETSGTKAWRGLEEASLALSLGAELCNEVWDCTHLIVMRRGEEGYTDKLLDALSPPCKGDACVEVVRPDWLSESKKLWKRADEDDFRVGGPQGWAELKANAAKAVSDRQRHLAERAKTHGAKTSRGSSNALQDKDLEDYSGDPDKCVSRKRAREWGERGAPAARSSQHGVHSNTATQPDLTPRAARTLISDAQSLLEDLDSMLDPRDSMLDPRGGTCLAGKQGKGKGEEGASRGNQVDGEGQGSVIDSDCQDEEEGKEGDKEMDSDDLLATLDQESGEDDQGS